MECVYGTSLLVAKHSVLMLLALLVSKKRAVNEISCQNLKSGDASVPVAAFLSKIIPSARYLMCYVFSEIMRKRVFGSQVQQCI